MSYVTNADAGCGLIRYGSALVPFINRFPRDTKLCLLYTSGLSLKSHDPSQRANGFLTLAGGVVITFAKEILTLITG